METIVTVLLPLPFNHGFSYFVGNDLKVEIGNVVKVPFRKSQIYGVVTDTNIPNNLDKKKIKTIICQEQNLQLSRKLLDFIKWTANYNLAPLGSILKLAISIINSSSEAKINKAAYLLKSNNKDCNSKLTAKRKIILEFLKNVKEPISAQDIIDQTDTSVAILNSMVKIGLLAKSVITISKETKKQFPQIKVNNFKPKILSTLQKKAANFLAEQIAKNQHYVTLIDGITGSGKTEVYFSAITKILQEQKGQVLILLPEIILTTQLIDRFENQFGFTPEIWHSKITNRQKRSIFYGLANGQVKVLIGTRSALFLPFANLSLIIVDEEHESSFKQEDIVNYHGRDMAVLRGKIEAIPVILSSATPALESFLNAKNGKYHHLILNQRFAKNQHIDINLVDMRQQKMTRNHYISAILLDQLTINLAHGKQSLLFLNRRGYSPLVLCKACGYKLSCPNCSSYITYHQKYHKLICHHCGYYTLLSDNCPECQEEETLINCGAGVERIKEEILQYLPKSRIALMTSDNITNSGQAEKLITQILDHKIDIIIGTQIIAKGHHFPALSLVGIIDGDSSFHNANLRTAEKTYQLLTQVIGRAGREKYQGKIFLQTYNPDNLVFQNIINNSRNQFLELEAKNRQLMNMPPFNKMAAIIFNSLQEAMAVNTAKMILRKFPSQENIEIFGPAPMPITKIRNRYYYRLLIKTEYKLNIQKLISQILSKTIIPNQVRVKVDIDPL